MLCGCLKGSAPDTNQLHHRKRLLLLYIPGTIVMFTQLGLHPGLCLAVAEIPVCDYRVIVSQGLTTSTDYEKCAFFFWLWQFIFPK